MLDVKDKEILFHIIDHSERVIDNIKNIKLDDFYNNRNLQDIVLFNIFQIGELSKSLSDEFINEYNGVPWKQIKGMRDIIVHGYQSISYERTYNTAKKDILDLYKYCKKIYKE